jgi:hypothetical protein
MKKIIAIISILATVCIILFVPFKQVFSFEETRTNNGQVVYIPFHKDELAFQFIYTHSIHLSDVVEYYEVTNDLFIRAIAMEYEDLAVGMPGYAEDGETLTIEDGKYRLAFASNITPSFTMHISNISSKQHFLYFGVEYDLKKVLKKGSSYLFRLKKISIFQWWKGGFDKYE